MMDRLWDYETTHTRNVYEQFEDAVSEDKKVEWTDGDYQRGFVHGWNGNMDHIKQALGEQDENSNLH